MLPRSRRFGKATPRSRPGKAGAVGAPSCMTAGAFCTSPLSRRNRSGQNGPAGPPCLAVVGTRAFYNRFKTGRSDFAASGLPIGSDFRDYRFCFSDMAQNCRFPGSPRKDRANGLLRPNLKRSCGRWAHAIDHQNREKCQWTALSSSHSDHSLSSQSLCS